mmetsp:Transcript_89894/g.196733  ORF Transcript_89894/g.196733 Transcript_89894/m.196733 type:complete len:214 (+) Transcript_89894:89-730(+)
MTALEGDWKTRALYLWDSPRVLLLVWLAALSGFAAVLLQEPSLDALGQAAAAASSSSSADGLPAQEEPRVADPSPNSFLANAAPAAPAAASDAVRSKPLTREQALEHARAAFRTLGSASGVSEEDRNLALLAAERIASNVINHPSEERYQRIWKVNQDFNAVLGKLSGSEALMESLGFQDSSDKKVWVYNTSPASQETTKAHLSALQEMLATL